MEKESRGTPPVKSGGDPLKKGTAMKLLRIVRNVVLLVLALCLCAVLALAFLGWQM